MAGMRGLRVRRTDRRLCTSRKPVAESPSKVAKQTSRVAILVHEDAALAMAMLMRDLLLRANRWLGRPGFAVSVVGRRGLAEIRGGFLSVKVSRPRRPGHLLVPPLAAGADPFRARAGEAALIRRLHRSGTAI